MTDPHRRDVDVITARPEYARLAAHVRDQLDAEERAALRQLSLDRGDPEPDLIRQGLDEARAAAFEARQEVVLLAARLARVHLGVPRRLEFASLKAALLSATYQSVRALRDVERGPDVPPAREPSPEQLRAPLRRVDVARLSRDVRDEHNLIARAITLGHCLPEPDERPEKIHLPEPRQPVASLPAADMDEHFRGMLRAFAALERAVSTGNFEEALRLTETTAKRRADWARATRAFDEDRKDFQSGRAFDGTVFFAELPIGEELASTPIALPKPDALPLYFDLIVVHAGNGYSWEIANATEIELLSGVRVGDDGWAEFAEWLREHDARGQGRLSGRRQEGPENRHLVWRENDGALKLRTNLRERPGVLRALEAIRCTLRLARSGEEQDLLTPVLQAFVRELARTRGRAAKVRRPALPGASDAPRARRRGA